MARTPTSTSSWTWTSATGGLFPVIGLQEVLEHILGERVDVAPRDALAPHVAERALAEAGPL